MLSNKRDLFEREVCQVPAICRLSAGPFRERNPSRATLFTAAAPKTVKFRRCSSNIVTGEDRASKSTRPTDNSNFRVPREEAAVISE